MLSINWLVARFALLLSLSLTSAYASLIDVDHYRSLSSDRLGHALGDMLTVLVVEASMAQAAAGTGASSKTAVGLDASLVDPQLRTNIRLHGDSDGRGHTSRSGQVRTTVSVRIIEHLSNGMLRIKGEREVSINDEKAFIHISGLVRADDIAYDNTVLSYRLADAHIDINGDGVVTSAQQQSWLWRALKWLRIL